MVFYWFGGYPTSEEPRRIDFYSNLGPVNAAEKIRALKDAKVERHTGKQPETPDAVYERRQQAVRDRKPALLVEQIMTFPVVTISAEDSLEKAWRIVREKGYRHLPVIDDSGKPIGLLSDRDLMRGKPAKAHRDQNLKSKDPPETVSDLMATQVLTAARETEIREAARAMINEQIGCLPVVEEDGLLAGILTTTDIMRAVVNKAPLDLWI